MQVSKRMILTLYPQRASQLAVSQGEKLSGIEGEPLLSRLVPFRHTWLRPVLKLEIEDQLMLLMPLC
jgi:hypothetical protein